MNRKFSIEAELQFVTAFGNSIMAEVSQVAVSCRKESIELTLAWLDFTAGVDL